MIPTGMRRRRGWVLGREVPRASELLREILTCLSDGPLERKKLRKKVAREIGFDPARMAVRFEREGGASFNDSFFHAVQHLMAQSMIEIVDKQLSLSPLNLGKGGTVRIPQMPDYIVGSSNPPTSGSMSWPVDIPSLETALKSYSVLQLFHTYEIADNRFTEVEGTKKALAKQINAFGVMAHVREELIRRGLLSADGEVAEFRWPTTIAEGGNGRLIIKEVPAIGPLRALGYHVGKNSPPAAQRHRLLTKAFAEDIPDVQDLADWGSKGSSRRLKKIAESIAAFTRNAKRRKRRGWSDAILRWENDLEYLRLTHYVGRFDRDWKFPPTSV